jgi:CRISPR/Cas system-associated endonuclease Cas1
MVAEDVTTNFKMDNFLFKNHYSIIPLFHYSKIEVESQTSINTQYFHYLVDIPRH